MERLSEAIFHDAVVHSTLLVLSSILQTPDVIPAGSVSAHDVFFGMICRLLELLTYIDKSKTGATAVAEHVTSMQKVLLRDRILVGPHFTFHGDDWHSWLRLLFLPVGYQ